MRTTENSTENLKVPEEHRGFTEDEWRTQILGDSGRCYDCLRRYGDEYGFPDLLIPDWAWKKISPKGNEGGLLCLSCICKRLQDKGIRCIGAFMSGPIISVTEQTISEKVHEEEKCDNT